MKNKQVVVNEGNSGQRLDVFLTRYFQRISRSRLQKVIEKGDVFLNGTRQKPSARVQGGDIVAVRNFSPENVSMDPEHIPFEAVFYDEDIIVVNKPSGLVVHPAKKNLSGTLVNGLMYRFGPLAPSPNRVRPGIVHRLDKETSGLMVAARTTDAMNELKRQFKAREVGKAYYAIVHGIPRFESFVIDEPIGRKTGVFNKMVVSDDGKNALTEFRVIKNIKNYSLLKVIIKTGRTHQIRVHLSSIGHSVLGDRVYGHEKKITFSNISGTPDSLNDEVALSRLALHSTELSFTHPVKKKEMTFQTELPDEFEEFMDTVAFF